MEKKKRFTIELELETRQKLNVLKAQYKFSSYDALIQALINNTRRLKELLK
jgi:hypothetical protein